MPPANPLVTEITPGSRSKTASMHQKQPPPRSAISVLLVGFDSVVFMASTGLTGGTACDGREQEKLTAAAASKIKMVFLIWFSRTSGRSLQNGKSLHHFLLFRFRFVQVFAGRQVGIFFKMLRLE